MCMCEGREGGRKGEGKKHIDREKKRNRQWRYDGEREKEGDELIDRQINIQTNKQEKQTMEM